MRTGQFVNEAAISTGVVLPILNDLEWPVFDPTVVAPEFTVEGRRVDFALCHPRTRPAVFIEVKQPGRSEGADRQLFEYAFHLGVPLAVLTDGREWHFYLPAGQGLYQERRVYKLDLIERTIQETEERLKRYLAYQHVASGAAHRAAHQDYASLRKDREIAATVPEAWRKLLEDQDELLVDLIAEQVESLCGYRPDPEVIARFLSEQVNRGPVAPPPAHQPSPPRVRAPEPRPPVTGTLPATPTGATGYSINGTVTRTRNAKDTLIRFFEEMARRDESFYQRFAALPKHGRSRRFLATDRQQLYPERPDLASEYSHEIAPGWYIGTNYGSTQIRRIIDMACHVAGLRPNVDVQVNL